MVVKEKDQHNTSCQQGKHYHKGRNTFYPPLNSKVIGAYSNHEDG